MGRNGLLGLFLLAFASTAYAFHDGGVGECAGCHSLHPAETGAGKARPGGGIVLMGADAASTCLRCHLKPGQKHPASHLVATAEADMSPGIPPSQLTPGGDFGWIKKTYRWSGGERESGGDSPGELHGHNIVASDHRYVPDMRNAAAPGGTFPSARLSCISCHDPHGKYRRLSDGSVTTSNEPIRASGSYDVSPDPTAGQAVGVYRLLGGKGYSSSLHEGTPFTADPPAAVSPADYNRPEDRGETRVAYGKGMSEWCANCHTSMLGGRMSHPAGGHVKLSGAVAALYNAYVASGNLSGNPATSYLSLVPFEMGTADYALLKGAARTSGGLSAGPGASSTVMCLSCHRAHASGWDHATRWNMKAEFLVYKGDYPGTDVGDVPARVSQGRTRAEIRKTFGDRPASAFATYQRSLCNKCHGRD